MRKQIYDYNFDNISHRRGLSERFIEEHRHRLNWQAISKFQKLSEKFIEKYKYKVDWFCIFKYQKLSEKFIINHLHGYGIGDYAIYALKYQSISIDTLFSCDKFLPYEMSINKKIYDSDKADFYLIKYKSKINWIFYISAYPVSKSVIENCDSYIDKHIISHYNINPQLTNKLLCVAVDRFDYIISTAVQFILYKTIPKQYYHLITDEEVKKKLQKLDLMRRVFNS